MPIASLGNRSVSAAAESTYRVVVLAEDDAAVFEPGLPVALMLGEEVRDGTGLGVPRLGAGQILDDRVEVACFV